MTAVASTTVFLNSVVVIYFVEAHPAYGPLTVNLFQCIDGGSLRAVTSPITLAECLVVPQRRGDTHMFVQFISLITAGIGIQFIHIDEIVAVQSSVLRARYNLRLPDSVQLAAAMVAGCDLFLTNEVHLVVHQNQTDG